jgi:UDP-N-acetylglucosamine--N-acetylmuramyl-(pentapeptide) pyrophosphoryl-undecaprenol N-acetylglucosamine transferase
MNNANPQRILVMAGGTGGHVYPALTVARELLDAGCEVQWLGTRQGIEARLVPEAGIELHCLSITGLRGKRLLVLLKAPLLMLVALAQALWVCLCYRPHCVLGMGGFASGPGGLAAWLLRRPLVIQEQNAIPGTTNRILAKLAKVVLEGFDGAFTGAKAQFVGNPVRADIAALPPPEVRFRERSSGGAQRGEPLRLLVVGGSLGAQALNEVVPQALALMTVGGRPDVWHQTGATQGETTRERYRVLRVQGRVDPYIEDMASAYAWADVVLCRAGALTVSELAAAGVASVLVPYPHAVDDHQTRNAQWLVEREAALLLPQSELNADVLAGMLGQWGDEPAELYAMASRARACAPGNAARIVATYCRELAYG